MDESSKDVSDKDILLPKGNGASIITVSTPMRKAEKGIAPLADNRVHETRDKTNIVPGNKEDKKPTPKEPIGFFYNTSMSSPEKLSTWKVPIETIRYEVAEPACHVTVTFGSVGASELPAMKKIWSWLSAEYPTIKIKVLKTSPFKNTLRPDYAVRDVKISLPKKVLSVCSAFSRFDISPHISVPANVIKDYEGKTFEGKITFRVMYPTAKYHSTDLNSRFLEIPTVAPVSNPSKSEGSQTLKPNSKPKGES